MRMKRKSLESFEKSSFEFRWESRVRSRDESDSQVEPPEARVGRPGKRSPSLSEKDGKK